MSEWVDNWGMPPYEPVSAPMKACVLCGFEFPQQRWATLRTGDGNRDFELFVSTCSDHECLCCPACHACQSVVPTPELVERSLARRKYHGV